MTVVRRTFRSCPHRDASQTWTDIVNLLTQGKDSAAKTELMSIAGVAACIITEQAAKESAIVVTCDGPRTRIYCLYDEDAIDGGDANENSLGFDPLKGDWQVSLPCPADDLDWVRGALSKKSTRITARGPDEAVAADEDAVDAGTESLVLDVQGFLQS